MTPCLNLVEIAGNLLALATAVTNFVTTVRNQRPITRERHMDEPND
jgi:hypothetical protein